MPNPHASANPGSYSIGVLHAGALLAGEVTGDRRFTDYTAIRLQFIAERLPYFQMQADTFGLDANPFRNFSSPPRSTHAAPGAPRSSRRGWPEWGPT